MNMYRIIKRFFDILLSITGIIVLSPLLVLLSIVIKLDSKGPILFKQKRVGINKSYFMIYKFRTMQLETPNDLPTHLLGNPDMFITRIGSFLRKTSLDELPQLFNIFLGQMSIIGPRPALWNQYDLIAARDKVNANSIRPGLTGWAQINGRDEIPIEVKAVYDGYYIENVGLFFDIKIFIKTILNVLNSEGVKEGSNNDTDR